MMFSALCRYYHVFPVIDGMLVDLMFSFVFHEFGRMKIQFLFSKCANGDWCFLIGS